jgi:Protein of unknown function (DUF992)
LRIRVRSSIRKPSAGVRWRANVLVGGSFRTVELQPISAQLQTGINVAAGVAEIGLHFVR